VQGPTTDRALVRPLRAPVPQCRGPFDQLTGRAELLEPVGDGVEEWDDAVAVPLRAGAVEVHGQSGPPGLARAVAQRPEHRGASAAPFPDEDGDHTTRSVGVEHRELVVASHEAGGRLPHGVAPPIRGRDAGRYGRPHCST
jgi:hypothetical protein